MVEAAAELGVSIYWIRRRMKVLPHHRYGYNFVRFTTEDIEAIKAQFQVNGS